jgi:hypothetical protein
MARLSWLNYTRIPKYNGHVIGVSYYFSWTTIKSLRDVLVDNVALLRKDLPGVFRWKAVEQLLDGEPHQESHGAKNSGSSFQLFPPIVPESLLGTMDFPGELRYGGTTRLKSNPLRRHWPAGAEL